METITDDAKNWVKLEGDPSGDCRPRGGDTVYVRSTNSDKAIYVTIETQFDGGTPYFEYANVPPLGRVRIGCSQWLPDIGHVQLYVRKIKTAKYV